MDNENITYARGRVVELGEEIEALRTQLRHLRKSLCSLTCREEIAVREARALLDDYEEKSEKLSETFKTMYEIQEKWGLKR